MPNCFKKITWIFAFNVILQYWNSTNCWDLFSWETRKCTFDTDNSLWPSVAKWQIKLGSTLAKVVAHCLMAASYYLTQCWVIISETLWHWTERNLTRNVQDIYPWYKFQNYKSTHWDQVTHICVSKLAIIGSDNGFLLRWCQANIWTNAWILVIWPLRTNFIENLLGIQRFLVKKMHLKMLSVMWRSFCLGLNVLKITSTSPKVQQINTINPDNLQYQELWHQ